MSSHLSETPDPPRPRPPRRLGAAVMSWVTWFGAGRLVAAACSVVVIAAGAYWLVRAPLPPTEAGLPVASAASAPAAAPTTVGARPDIAGEALGPVVVHVVGAVVDPGVYELAPTARVHEAIEAAGGPSSVAALDGVNLASTLVDGQRVYVPIEGEVDPAAVPSEPDSTAASGAETPAGPIDVNRAPADELERLPGIGPSTAAAIIDDRERNGPFLSVDDLDRVAGIGAVRLEALRDLVTV